MRPKGGQRAGDPDWPDLTSSFHGLQVRPLIHRTGLWFSNTSPSHSLSNKLPNEGIFFPNLVNTMSPEGLLQRASHLRPAIVQYLALSAPKVSGWEQGFAKNLAPGSPLASSFPPVRRRCHPSLGPRQGHNSAVWVLATDTITWAADKTHLPGTRRAEPLLTHNSLVLRHSYRWPWNKKKKGKCITSYMRQAHSACSCAFLYIFHIWIFMASSLPHCNMLS